MNSCCESIQASGQPVEFMTFIRYRRFMFPTRLIRVSCLGGLLLALPAFSQDVEPLRLSGVPGDYTDQFYQQLTRLQAPCSVSAARLRAVMNRNQSELTDLTRAIGYYRASWTVEEEILENGCRQIRIQIDAGPRARILQTRISLIGPGQDDPVLKGVIRETALRTGAPVDHAAYEQFKGLLTREAQRRGYFDATFQRSQLLVDPTANSASIQIEFNTGVRYRYGELQTQQQTISAELLSRFSTIEPGQNYQSTDVQQLQQDLLNSRYFSSVVVRPLVDDRENGLIDVHLDAQPNDRWRYEAGLGVATDTGPSLSLGVDNRRVTADGQRASFDSMLSDTIRSGEISYSIPLENPVSDRLQWQLGYREENTESAIGRQISVGVSRVTLRDSGWIRTTSLDYSIEDTDISTQDFTSQMLVPGIGWQRSVSDGARRIMDGWRLSYDVRGGSSAVASDFDFLQTSFQVKIIRPLGNGRLLARADLGATWVESVSLLPTSLRFFAGGDNSIRGYNFEEVGPKDSLGEVVGGRHLAVGSLEYAWAIRENWDLALFADGGNAFDDSQFSWKQGAGLGVRWHSLIGTLRFDIAFNDESDTRFHIFIGPEL